MQGPHHLIADAKCTGGLDDLQKVMAFACAVVNSIGLTSQRVVWQEFSNGSQFGPGITVLHLLSESHLALHTAPDRHYLNLDIFSCKPFDAAPIWGLLEEHFGVERLDRWDVLWRHG